MLGTKVLRKSLGHATLRRANEEQRAIVVAFKARIEAALKEAQRRASLPVLDREALEWNAALVEERAREEKERRLFRPSLQADWKDEEVSEEERLAETPQSQFADRLEAVAGAHGMGAMERFRGIAKGTATPLAMHVEEWLQSTPHDPKGNGLKRRAVRRLIGWCERSDVDPVVEAITPYVAARFEDAEFPIGSTPATTFSSYRTAYRSYWRWMQGRGFGPGTAPWEGRQRASFKPHRVEAPPKKRPFTDDEVQALLAGPASSRLHDAMRIAALSGMRLGEIARLRVRDCVDGVFNIRVSKTVAGVRIVPVHSGLQETVARLTANRPDGAYLIDGGLDEPPADAERTRHGPLTKEFTRYRRRLEVDDKPDIHRQSNIDFHSFRRWFIDRRQRVLAQGGAAFTEGTLKDVVGHDRGALGMTAGTYAGTAPIEEKQRCVEAVGLP